MAATSIDADRGRTACKVAVNAGTCLVPVDLPSLASSGAHDPGLSERVDRRRTVMRTRISFLAVRILFAPAAGISPRVRDTD
jgi:hypothetical protein